MSNTPQGNAQDSKESNDHIKKGIENHKKSAAHLEKAAKHHLDAASHHESGQHEKAAQSTVLAHGHTGLAQDEQREYLRLHASAK